MGNETFSMYSKILVPVDGTPPSEQALRHARPLATAHRAELVLLKAVAPEPSMTGAVAAAAEPTAGEAEAYLDTLCRQLTDEGLKARAVVVRDQPEHAILKVVSSEGIDLVILASHSQSGYERWSQGSVPGRLLKAAPCPILLVWAPTTGGTRTSEESR